MTVKVPSTGYAQQLINAGDGPCLIINRDLVTPLIIADDNSQIGNKTIIGDPNLSVIDALGSIAVDGIKPVFGLATAGSIEVDIKKGAINWSPSPAQVAAQINALGLAKDASVLGVAGQVSTTGAPTLVFKNIIDVLLSQNIPANSSVTRGAFTINQPDYEILLGVNTAGASAPILSVEFQWIESFSGLVLEDETYYIYSGNAAGHQIHGRGPTKADRLKVILKNNNVAIACSVTYVIIQTSSRNYTREFWRTVMQGGVAPIFPGFNASTMNMPSNWLAGQTNNIAASSNNIFLLPLYTGSVRLYAETGSAVAGKAEWVILDNSDQIILGSAGFKGLNGQSGYSPNGLSSLYIPDIALPRSQCTLQVINNDTVAQNLFTGLLAKEDRS